jgi:preprotein translocase subunit SecB
MTNIPIQPAIRLVKVTFPDVSLKVSSSVFAISNMVNSEEIEMSLSYNLLFNNLIAESSHQFAVDFTIHLVNTTKDFQSTIKMLALFETNVLIDDTFKTSTFIQVNAPAIAFPYLRSFVTTITSNAGLKPIVLPAINLTKN